jgi:AcrR family transcriptional regulator
MAAEIEPAKVARGTGSGTRAAILAAAGDVLGAEPDASVEAVTRQAGVSRATFYRHFGSRTELLAALEIAPDPGTRDRILAAAADLVGRHGLREMSMDELAAQAGVSRASVYRLFPGKPALFDALVAAYSPFDELLRVLDEMADRPAAEVLPAMTRAMARVAAPRVGVLRSLFFEVTAGSPDARAGSDARLARVLGAVAAYLQREMTAGRLRPSHPLLAAQALMGPVVFHLISRTEAEHLGIMPLPLEAAVDGLTTAVLGGLLAPTTTPSHPGASHAS